MRKIRKGDQVMITTGKSKGASGTVQRVIDNERVVVEGINMVKRHTRPNPQKNQGGGIVEKEASLHISNVAHINPGTGKPGRIGMRTLDDGRKVRYFKNGGEVIDI